MNLRQLPNAITGLRLVMAPLLPWLLLAGHYRIALGVALAAGLSDALDGFIARRFGWQTRLGSLLDPIADKLMLGLTLLGLMWIAVLPAWLVALVIVRDVVILAGAAAWWRLAGPFEGQPSLLGKVTTALQVALVLLCLVELSGLVLPLQVRIQCVLVVGLLTFVSGVDYVIRYGVRAWRHKRIPPA
jgi:cardiolipin synthase